MNWVERRLGDFIEIKHGFAFKGELFVDEGKYVVLTPGNFHLEGGLKLTGKEKSYEGEFPPSFIFGKNDLVVVMTDLIQDAPILGGALLIPQDGKYLHNQRLGKVEIEAEIDRLFLYYAFNWEYYRGQVRGSATGSTVRHTAPERIYQCKIPLPSLLIQHRIAEVLGQYDALIENYQRQIGILEAMAQNLYREWFVRGRCPYAQASKPLVRLEEVVTTQYGFTASAMDEDTGVRFLRITDISGNRIDWADVPFCEVSDDEFKKYELKTGDIVVARIGATAGYGRRIHKRHPKSVFASYLVRMQVKNPLHDYFVGMSVESQDFKDFINQTAGGAAQPQANAPILTGYEIKLPSDEALNAFNAKVEPLFDLAENLECQITSLRQMRDKLLPRLMSGQLSIKATSVA